MVAFPLKRLLNLKQRRIILKQLKTEKKLTKSFNLLFSFSQWE